MEYAVVLGNFSFLREFQVEFPVKTNAAGNHTGNVSSGDLRFFQNKLRIVDRAAGAPLVEVFEHCGSGAQRTLSPVPLEAALGRVLQVFSRVSRKAKVHLQTHGARCSFPVP